MKKVIGFSLLLLLGAGCNRPSSSPTKGTVKVVDTAKERCNKILVNKDELIKNSNLDYDQEILKYTNPTAKKKEEVRRSSWSFRSLNYLMVQNPNCFEPLDVAWAQFWIDSFNRSEQVVKG